MTATSLEAELGRAVSKFQRAPFRKLLSPTAFRYLSRAYHRRTHGVTRKAHLFFGEDLEVMLPEVVSESLWMYGFFDEEVTRMAIACTLPGATVVDVGAHFGYFSTLFAFLAGPQGRVYSFEPSPSTFEILNRNAQKRTTVIPVNAAAGRSDSTLRIKDFGLRYAAWNTLSGESRMPGVLNQVPVVEREVQVLNLDRFLAEKNVVPTVIKIDAEGFELEVIAGLHDTLRSARPKLIMECGTQASLEAGAYLRGLNYDAFKLEGRSVVRITGDLSQANFSSKDLLFFPSA